MKGRKPLKTRVRRAFISAVAIIGFGGGGVVTLDHLPKDSKTDTQKITTIYVDHVATHGYNISPVDQFWKASLSLRSIESQEKDLLLAAEKGDAWRIKALFEQDLSSHRAAIQAMDIAAANGHADILNLLKAHYPDFHYSNARAFMHFLEGQHFDLAQDIFAPHVMAQSDKDKALLLSAQYSHSTLLKGLLDAGADANTQNGKALTLASRMGDIESVMALLAQTTTTTHFYRNPHQMPAQSVSDYRHPRHNLMDEMAHGLVPFDEDIFGAPAFRTETTVKPTIDVASSDNDALMEAVMNNHADIVAALIRAGANVDKDRDALLMIARIIDNPQIADMLSNASKEAKGVSRIFQDKSKAIP